MNLNDKFFEQTLAIDFGNSRAKLLYKNLFKSFKYSANFLEDFRKFFFAKVNPPIRVLYSSVNNEQSNLIISFLNSLPNVYIYDIRDLIFKQKKINLFNYHWVGTDRILGLIGALEEFAPPLITVDIGTAVTVNCVDERQNFVGGLIFPGPETQVKSLQENTSLLKNIKLERKDFEDFLEISTEGAISSGVLNSIWGGLLFLLDGIRKNRFMDLVVPIVFTGGGFIFFKGKFQSWNYEKKYHRKHLVLSGIISLAKSERQYLIDFNE